MIETSPVGETPSSEPVGICRICGFRGERVIYAIREMMFTTKEVFRYGHCPGCGCLQIEEIPTDLGRYYPAGYYSMRTDHPDLESPLWFRIALKWRVWIEVTLRRRWWLFRDRIEWRLPPAYAPLVGYLRDAGISRLDAAILDVGCGANAYRLSSLREMGFCNLLGVDPFIPEDLHVRGIAVLKRSIEEVAGSFDLIMFHHSLEHMKDPLEALRAAVARLRPGGVCLVRIPVMSSALWSQYGLDWVELDAPRHLHILERRTMSILARRAGMEIYKVSGDTSAWEFLASERYHAGLSSVQVLPDEAQQTVAERAASLKYEAAAAAVNAAGTSGRACFFLRVLEDAT